MKRCYYCHQYMTKRKMTENAWRLKKFCNKKCTQEFRKGGMTQVLDKIRTRKWAIIRDEQKKRRIYVDGEEFALDTKVGAG